MAKITFSLDTNLPAEAVLAAAIDFTENRLHYWPNIDPRVYKVHGTTASTADVTEGSAMLGGIWAREAYDWSQPNNVLATVQDSNAFRPGGKWHLRATPLMDGGCRVEVVSNRVARGFKGIVIGAMLTLFGARVMRAQLQQTLHIIAKDMALNPTARVGARVETM